MPPVLLEGERQQQQLQTGLIESIDIPCRGQGMKDVRILKQSSCLLCLKKHDFMQVNKIRPETMPDFGVCLLILVEQLKSIDLNHVLKAGAICKYFPDL